MTEGPTATPVLLRDATDLAVELVGNVRAGDGPAVDRLLASLNGARLANLAVAMAYLVDDSASVTELHRRLTPGHQLLEGLEAARCAPELWGASVASRAAHGTRSRYNAGCRGAACKGAEADYYRVRVEKGSRPGPAQRAAAGHNGVSL